MPMIDEQICRRASFQEVTSIQLADGQRWWLPELSIDSRDAVLHSLVKAVVCGSDEQEEALRDQLALTMVLLSRNYQLSPDLYPQLFSFEPDDPARDELQRVVRELALSAPFRSRVELVPNLDRKPRPSRRWGLTAASESLMRVRSRWSLRSH
jgi:hypothetical protein